MAADSAAGRVDSGGSGSASLLYDYFNPGGDRNYQDRDPGDFAGIKMNKHILNCRICGKI